MEHHSSTKGAILGGIVLSIGGSLHPDDFIRTAILAIVGASVSFIASILLKWLCNYLNQWNR